MFQHTAARRRLPCRPTSIEEDGEVSTHSRPKAAAADMRAQDLPRFRFQHTAARRRLRCGAQILAQRLGFNTQPPEGGCKNPIIARVQIKCFNTQPPEGGCAGAEIVLEGYIDVSTHSRPKAAAVKQNYPA